MSIEQRNAFFKGILAARRGKVLSDVPSNLGSGSIGMWIAGFNDEKQRIESDQEQQGISDKNQ